VALTDLDTVKRRLGIATTVTTQDDVLADIIEETDSILKTHLGQNIETATYTEFYCGNGSQSLLLRQIPVQSITSIHVDADGYFNYGNSAYAAADLLVSGTDYALSYVSSKEYSPSGIVYRIGTVWPKARFDAGLLTEQPVKSLGNIKVVYVAGYPTVPARYRSMATKLACWKFATDLDGVTKTSESHSDTSYSYSLGDLKGLSIDAVLENICGGAREFVV